jgi:hypothetical protein
MMKVYIVIAGWCDDTWIDSVHDSEDKAIEAEKHVEPFNKNNPNSTWTKVECFEVQ